MTKDTVTLLLLLPCAIFRLFLLASVTTSLPFLISFQQLIRDSHLCELSWPICVLSTSAWGTGLQPQYGPPGN